MKMTSQQREQLRLSLLRFLDENPSRFGLPTDFLLQAARSEGRPSLDFRDAESELEYLADKTLCAEVPKIISPEKRAWKISATGRDFLAQQHAD